jgi:hypothetical protein
MREKAITPFSYCPVNFFQASSDGAMVGWPVAAVGAVFAFILLYEVWVGCKGEFAGEPSGKTLHIAVVA